MKGMNSATEICVGAFLPKATAQSAAEGDPKSNICTLDCTLEKTAVLRWIETNPKMTQKEMALTIRKSERTIKAITSALVERRIIIRRNERRNGWWKNQRSIVNFKS